ncbi:MAG: hypothetical protein Roseis2KO_16940 [Roseivirga sp.]
MEYKIFRMKAFDNPEKIEKRLNDLSMQGWRVVTSMNHGTYLVMAKGK